MVKDTPNSKMQHKLDSIYRAANETLAALLDTRNMYIALFNEKDQLLTFPLVYVDGNTVAESEKFGGKTWGPRKLGSRLGLTEKVIRDRKALLVADNFDDWIKTQPDVEAHALGTKCWLGSPMILGSRVLGVIGLQNFERESVFDKADCDLLETVAAQAAVAIENVRLVDARISAERDQERLQQQEILANERMRRLGTLQEITQLISQATQEPDEILRHIAEAANDITHADVTSVFRYHHDMDSFSSGFRVDEGEYHALHEDDLPDADGVVAEIARSGTSLTYPDSGSTDKLSRWAMANDIQSYTGWPLAVTDINGFNKVVGVLVVNYKERREVDEEQARFLHHLAALAGIAIEYIEDKQQRYANEQLAALGSATTALQHRLSNTINVTLPAVMRLRYRVGQDPESQKILDVIERNTEFANDVVRRMRYPLRQEEFAPVDFGALLNKAISDCLSQNEKDVCLFTGDQTMTSISDASIVVISRISSLPESYARSSSLTEVFRVLVENAVKAVRKSTHSPGKITITGRLIEAGPQNRQEVEVIVEDNGEGMSDETKQRLFRQPVPRKEFGEGAGLGLWLSNIIIKSHRGTIAFASQLGEGTTFRLRLPILTQPPVEQSVLRSLSALEGGAE